MKTHTPLPIQYYTCVCVRIGETRATEVNSQLPDVFREKSECMAIEAESEELPRRQERTRRDV